MNENLPQVIEPSNTDLSMTRDPSLVLQEAQRAAAALRDVITKKQKPVIFNGEQYLEFEDWQTVGRFYGVTAKVLETKPIDMNGELFGYEARAVAVLVTTGDEISAADGMCLKDEKNWKDKPLFQLRSMAQTRACAKALRNVLAWVVVLAGYRATPAEEMESAERQSETPSTATVRPPQQKAQAQPPNGDTAKEPAPVGTIRYIRDVHIEEGENQKTGKAWTRYDVYFEGDAKKYTTFSATVGEVAEDAFMKAIGIVVDTKSVQSGKYTNYSLEHIEAIPGSERQHQDEGESLANEPMPF